MANPSQTVVRRGTNAVDLARIKGSPVWVESPLSINTLVVYWTPQVVTGKTLNGHNIYRHIIPRFNPGDPGVVQLNVDGLVTVPLWVDKTVDMSRKQQFYYLLTQHFTDFTEIPIDYPVSLNEARSNAGERQRNINMPAIYQEWRRRKGIILDKTAEQVQYLVQRTSGARCECFDPKFEHVTYGNCVNCYGTGFQRGYELLPDVKMRVLQHQEILRLKPAGLELSANPKCWIVDFPMLRNGDVVCRRNGLRYEVDSTDVTIHQNILTEQNAELIALPQNHLIYTFPLVAQS